MNLDKPLVFFDLETTGVDVKKDRIVELSVIKVMPDGTKETKTKIINPGIPIPKESSDIHGITDDKVKDEPTFEKYAKSLNQFLEGCDLGGYNIVQFDVPLLKNEFARVGINFSLENRRFIDSFKIFCEKFPRTLTGAYRYYCEKELGEDAHGAEADTLASLEVFEKQMEQYEELNDFDEIHKLSTKRNEKWIDETGKFHWSGNTAIMGFGKHRGKELKVIAMQEPGFLKWVMKNDFPDDAKQIASDALQGVIPQKS